MLALLGTGVGLLVAGVLWVLVTGLMARSQLRQVGAELPQLRSALLSGQLHRAQQIASDIRGHAARAHDLTTGPAWWVSANLPAIGTPLRTGRTVAAATERIGTRVLPGVLALGRTLDGPTLRHGATIDLPRLERAQPVLDRAAETVGATVEQVRDAPASSWLSPVDDARARALHALERLRDDLRGAGRAMHTALPMLGAAGPRRYFVGFENEAEARGLGGLPGAFAIVVADHGRLRFTHFENDSALRGISAGKVDLGAGFLRRYGSSDPTGTYIDSDVSPHFPYAARIWAAMWQRASGEHVDGAVAIDPTALQYLLRVTGPVTVGHGLTIGAGNVVSFTESGQYARFTDRDRRKAVLVTMARSIAARLLRGSDSTRLIRAAAHAAGERRLVLWSADRAVERRLVAAGYAGALPSGTAPVSGFTVTNVTGTKLDYYLERSMTYRRSGCGPRGTATATLRLTNTAPRSGLPAYVTTRYDRPPPDARTGDNRLLVSYYATAGARIEAVRVDGRPVTVAAGTEQGLAVITLDVELPAGASRILVVRTAEPPARERVRILKQPLARDLAVSVTGAECG